MKDRTQNAGHRTQEKIKNALTTKEGFNLVECAVTIEALKSKFTAGYALRRASLAQDRQLSPSRTASQGKTKNRGGGKSSSCKSGDLKRGAR